MKTVRNILLCSIALTGGFTVMNSQSIYPGQFEEKIVVKGVSPAARSFELNDIRVLPGRVYDNMERDGRWLRNISIDRMLHSFFNNSGVWGGKEGGYMTVKKYGGWESLDCELRGHTTGHLLSAYALMFAATGDEIFKQKGDSLVDGLRKVQNALGNGYLSAFPEELINRNIRGESVWAPWYTLHKILSGLQDQYLYAGNSDAFETARKMGDWAYDKVSGIDDETRRKMLNNEFGGINEAFYNLYSLTGDEKYRRTGDFFYHNAVIDPLKERNGDFGTKHTNTFIPKVIGEMRKYELTGDESARDLSGFFFDEMIAHHIFVPGCLSDKEHFFDPSRMHEHISGYTGETCCTYNMLKLTRHLFSADPDARLFDYYERALYNHILGQQDPETGMLAYFLPLATGSHKVYSTPESSFWCCVGSGFESHSKYGESIYFRDNDDSALYVNLFIPSELNWKERGVTLRQTTEFPYENVTVLSVEPLKPERFALKIRVPSWASNYRIKVNGKKENIVAAPGNYAVIERKWKKGDKVEVSFDMEMRVEHPEGDGHLGALVYGPVVLAGRLGTDGMQAPAPYSNPELYNDYYTYDFYIPAGLPESVDISNLKKTGGLKWETSDGIAIEPLYDIHGERYIVYWNILR